MPQQYNQWGQAVGVTLAQFVPCQFRCKTEEGQSVRLIPMLPDQLDDSLLQRLWQTVQLEPDERCWTYLPYSQIQSMQQLLDYFQQSFHFAGLMHYVIEVGDAIVGWVALLNVRPAHAVIEIGNVYFSSLMKQSTAATETIYLLLKACFAAGYRRVEWKCDDLNTPSKNAALRFGFQFEGLFRQHVIVKGRNRDTAWFAMLDQDWPMLSQAYAAWLDTNNFDEQGQQKVHLKEFMQLYYA